MPHRYLIASALLLAAVSVASAQGAPTPASVCALLSKPEVEKELGRKIYQKGDGMSLGKNGAACDFDGDEAQVMVFADPGAEANWEGMLKSFQQDKNRRTPVPGLGSSAYVIYPPPRNEYQATVAMLVVRAGKNLVVVSPAAAKGKPAESALPSAIALTKLVLPRIE
jgi:hypothetical protein